MPRPSFTRIRPARPSDAGELTAFERKAFTGYYAGHRFSRSQFEYYLSRTLTISFVAISRAGLAGYVLGIRQRGGRLGVCRLLSIAVAPRFKRQGLGQRLLRAFMRAAAERSCRSVSLEVAAPNAAARQLFSGNGFEPIRMLPGYYSSAVDGFRMRRTLASHKEL